VVLVNNKSWHGTCHMFWPPGWPYNPKDWGEGCAIGYFSLGRYAGEMGQILIHETNGHAFAKLADEYVTTNATIPNNEKENAKRMFAFGWDKNIDFTSDPAQIKWAKYLSDTRYNGQGLGVYEGGNYYAKGVWRPTYQSMMNSAQGEFNAPSREAIYYRIHKLAYGASWQYDHETFVAWDLAQYGKSTRTAQAPPAGFGVLEPRPHTPPVFGGSRNKMPE
jgi:hypothetical protein